MGGGGRSDMALEMNGVDVAMLAFSVGVRVGGQVALASACVDTCRQL